MTVPPLFDPADFRIPAGVAHVCAGGETPFLRRHDAALARYAEDKSAGSRGRTAQGRELERARGLTARLWGVEAGDIGWVSSVAEGVSMVMESLDWRDGDGVAMLASEYPSVVAPFAAAKRVRLTTAATAEALVAAIDARTRVVGVSCVSFLNGERYDLAALRQAADAVDALLIVDFTQASGYLPIEAAIADFAFSAAYKWMLGMTGIAVAFWNRARRPDWAPSTAGWFSLASDAIDYAGALALKPDALRFTRGNPSFPGLYVLASALDYLAPFEPARIQRHVQALTVDLLGRLDRHGIPAITPAAPARHGASVAVATPAAAALVARLDDLGVHAWNGRGRIRFSFHGYNGTADVDRIEQALLRVWPA